MTLSFTGLSAFPLTPADAEGVVDTDTLARLVERLASAAPESIGLLGSTGIYAYLDRAQRRRAVAAAVEAAGGRVPVIVGIGALRTSWALDLARDAEAEGAAGLLLAPVSYTPLTQDEAEHHFRAVAGATALPLCVYNNPGTTGFRFTPELIGRLSAVPGIAAIKMPLPADGDFAGELRTLRGLVPERFAIGYSGDWGAAPALLAGGAAWYSVVAGLLPGPALRLTRAALAGQAEEAAALDAAFAPLWALFRAHGSLRVMYLVADRLGLPVGDPPLPLRRPGADVAREVEAALDRLSAL
ncbi:MAG: dihydrodipicolinate synthase family protein [Pseudomonadota bacterium]